MVLSTPLPHAKEKRPVETYLEPQATKPVHEATEVQYGDSVQNTNQTFSGPLGVLNLRDAYLHVHVAREHSLFLCFRYEGTSYRLSALPFGLSTAPSTFTRLVRITVSHLRRMGIQIFVYLDDWLVVAQSEAELKEDTRKALEITTSLGWIVNYDKSSLSAAQKVTYI